MKFCLFIGFAYNDVYVNRLIKRFLTAFEMTGALREKGGFDSYSEWNAVE